VKAVNIVMEQFELGAKSLMKKYTQKEEANYQGNHELNQDQAKDQYGTPLENIETTYGGRVTYSS
jgi:hypothetical protein